VYCWEKHFEGLIADSRADEVRAIWSGKFLVGIFSSCFIFGTKLSTFCSVAIYIYYTAAADFSAEKIFFLIALLNAVRVSVSIFFPLNCVFASEAYGSAKRIQEFLMLEEQSDSSNQMNKEVAVGEIQIKDTNASWNGKEDVLTGISLSVKPQELIVCAGKVGAGKSSLLALVMNELKITSGKALSNGNISYCPQEAWIFIGSIRENILFGASYNEQKYNEIVKLSALSRDIELFPEGDMTIVGDKGVSLSGGQRARINFARALYREADIYIFDDPFSAVDPKVGKKLAYTIQTYLTNKTRLIITHQEHYLPKYNQLITIADGKITKNEKNEDLQNIVLEEPTEDSTISLPKVQPEKSAQEKFKEKNEEGSLSWKMLKGYLSMRYPLFGWLIYFAFESSGMGLVYFSDIWLKIWVSNVEEQTRDLCAQNSANLSIAVNDTRFLPSVENCETVNLMDLPYSDYYKNVYLGILSLHIQSVRIIFSDISRDSLRRYRLPNNLSSNVRHDECVASQQDDAASYPCTG
jgi:ATP-binding cassette subfamily C (CFTR/MRP) protein 4